MTESLTHPDTTATATTPVDGHLVSFVDPTSFEAEQYRRLRQRLEDLNTQRRLRVLAVTSAIASDGKTLTAVNLAGALAQSRGLRVLLIDADLRHPSVANHLGLTVEAGDGLPAALHQSQSRVQDFVRHVDGSRLAVLPCGTSRADTYELLSAPRFSELVAEARRLYDYVVIDTPPLVPVPDGTLLRRLVDGFLVVVSANSTPRKLLAETLNLLDPASVVGLVFNRDDRPMFGYYRACYRPYYRAYVRSLNRRATA